MESIGHYLRTVYAEYNTAEKEYWLKTLKSNYGIDIQAQPGVQDGFWIVRQVCQIFKPVPAELVKACGVNSLILRADMGLNRSHFPNHGYYVGNHIALNVDIFYHPDQPSDFMDHRGYFLTRPEQTLLHEISHAYDFHHGDLSKKDAWLKISGWSDVKKPGLKRLIINEPETPRVIGEMYYDPKAEFTRFYARRNSWDDWADSSAFYLGGLRDKVPTKKRSYFDNIYKNYY